MFLHITVLYVFFQLIIELPVNECFTWCSLSTSSLKLAMCLRLKTCVHFILLVCKKMCTTNLKLSTTIINYALNVRFSRCKVEKLVVFYMWSHGGAISTLL